MIEDPKWVLNSDYDGLNLVQPRESRLAPTFLCKSKLCSLFSVTATPEVGELDTANQITNPNRTFCRDFINVMSA